MNKRDENNKIVYKSKQTWDTPGQCLQANIGKCCSMGGFGDSGCNSDQYCTAQSSYMWGICKSKISDGDPCPDNIDSQCSKGKCAYTIDDSGNEYRICCPQSTQYAGGFYWCSGLGPHDICKHNVQCANGSCDNGRCN